jgi:RNA polymerase-binding transcription factor
MATEREEPMKRKNVTDRKRYEVLKEMLEDRRREIQDKLRSLRETLPAEAALVKDTEEQSVDDFVQEVDFALMEMKSKTLAKIDEAMHRLEDGSYGVCGECKTEIAEARLTALPFAALCRSCQEEVEQESALTRETRVFEAQLAKAFS